jgi:hypothetical protein
MAHLAHDACQAWNQYEINENRLPDLDDNEEKSAMARRRKRVGTSNRNMTYHPAEVKYHG